MSTDPNTAQHWGLLVGENVEPLPKVRSAGDAYIVGTKARRRKPIVVYRHNPCEPWRRFLSGKEVPTQLEFDWGTA
ncbi:hypothetical protein ACFVAV_27395 [Nocardia sp. NPDC057663]|uniref:hypothetical protein n=1 Tax=Nocardia sp. NPDC057663 TaxID=3346201 RepID=UPI0036703422